MCGRKKDIGNKDLEFDSRPLTTPVLKVKASFEFSVNIWHVPVTCEEKSVEHNIHCILEIPTFATFDLS